MSYTAWRKQFLYPGDLGQPFGAPGQKRKNMLYTQLTRVITNSRLRPPDALLQITSCLMAGVPEKDADYRAAIAAYLWLGRNTSLAPGPIDTLRNRVIGYFSDPAAVPMLIDYLETAPFPDGALIGAAGKHSAALPVLLRLALSRERETAWYALRTIALVPDQRVFETLVASLEDPHLYLTWPTALDGLLTWPGHVKPLPKAVVERLIELLQQRRVGPNVASVLARYAATEALDALQHYALDGRDDATRQAAIRAVLALGGAEVLVTGILRLITGPAPTRVERSRSSLVYLATLEPVYLARRFFVPGTDQDQRRAIGQVLDNADLGGLTADDLHLLREACDAEPPWTPDGELVRALRERIDACNPPEGSDDPGAGTAQLGG
jgi:hypothetical protein